MEPVAVTHLLSGRASIVWRSPRGELCQQCPVEMCGVLSGAFNPLHVGHRELQHAAAGHLGGDVCYELPVHNADKHSLSMDEITARCPQFEGAWLALTGAATFVDKSLLFPGQVFVVGIDTAERILQPRFYGGSTSRRDAALNEIASQRCSFLVAGRVVDGRLRGGDDLSIPAGFHELFAVLPTSAFRRDISSTDLRLRCRRGDIGRGCP